MTFTVGHERYGGRRKDETSLGQILKKYPVGKKRELAQVAYKRALAGDVRWAEFVLRASGESVMPADGSNVNLSLLVLWQQWQLTDEQRRRVLDRLTPETRAQLMPAFEGQIIEATESDAAQNARSLATDTPTTEP